MERQHIIYFIGFRYFSIEKTLQLLFHGVFYFTLNVFQIPLILKPRFKIGGMRYVYLQICKNLVQVVVIYHHKDTITYIAYIVQIASLFICPFSNYLFHIVVFVQFKKNISCDFSLRNSLCRYIYIDIHFSIPFHL